MGRVAGRFAAAAGLVACVLAGGCRGTSEVTFRSCLADLTNLAAFAREPLGQVKMISTYDRTEGNRDWGSLDAIGPDGWFTLADLEGPGCVKRIWQTNLQADGWRFRFDGEREPRLAVSMGEGIFGGQAPFLPPLCGKSSGGEYCYLPLPYARSLRIEAHIPPEKRGPNPMPFYHVNYETYGRGVRVESFPAGQGAAEQAMVEAVCQAWRQAERPGWGAVCGAPIVFRLEAGGSREWFRQDGAGTLRAFSLALKAPANAGPLYRAQLLRQVFVRLYWDGAAEPSVDVPIGDFFCNGLYRRTFRSLPLAVESDCFVCRFPMPFRRAARAELRNDSPTAVEVDVRVEATSGDPAPQAGYFHARWSQSMSSGSPLQVVEARGAGHLAGCYLIALGMDGTWTMLEGDEVILVDGEKTPSWHGTGMEDYFNGAWYYRGLFDLPLHGLLDKAGPRAAQYRFHLPDAVRFRKGLAMTFEFGDGNRAQGYMSGVGYWYQSEPHPSGTAVPPPNRRYPPLDQIGRTTVMTSIAELDGIGHLTEARERCLLHADELARFPDGAMLRLRAAAYTEAIEGFEKAKPEYEAVLAATPPAEVAAEAAKLLWFHEAATNGLLTANVNGHYRLYYDGRLVLEDNSFTDLKAARISLAPGRHVIAAEVQWTYSDNWLMTTVRGHATNLWADLTWRTSQAAGEGWTGADYDDSGWANCQTRWWLPKMAHFQFKPNPFVLMQHRETVGPAGEGSNAPGKTSYFRKTFVVPGP